MDDDGERGSEMDTKAEQAARMLAAVASGKRLLALCHMLEGQKSVRQLPPPLLRASRTASARPLTPSPPHHKQPRTARET